MDLEAEKVIPELRALHAGTTVVVTVLRVAVMPVAAEGSSRPMVPKPCSVYQTPPPSTATV